MGIRQSEKAQLEPAEHERFHQNYRDHYRDVWFVFWRKGLSSEECKDLTQETFVSGYRGFSDFREESSFKTWILQIARNLANNHVRDSQAGKRSGPEVAIEEMQDGGEGLLTTACEVDRRPDPLEETLAKERQTRLREAIDELPPQMRQCIYMRVYQMLKYREIAELLGININTVKSQIFQAKERLKTLMVDLLEEDSDSSERD